MKWHREWFIRVPWGKMALVSRGHPDGEPVLLVHGRQDSLSIFEPLIEQMSEQYYYVALDMPGNGLSDAFPHVTNKPLPKNELNYAVVFNKPPRAGRPFIEFNKYDQSLTYLHKTTSKGPKLQRFHFLYAMELTLLHLGWDKFIFMGHSMGCEQGLFYNVLYPGQITKMILLDAGPTLMRMQIEDNAEYQKLFYDSYYENYHRDNFMRKAHTRLSASQSLRRLRDLSEAQCEHLLERNFHAFGLWFPIEVWHPNDIRIIARKTFVITFDVDDDDDESDIDQGVRTMLLWNFKEDDVFPINENLVLEQCPYEPRNIYVCGEKDAIEIRLTEYGAVESIKDYDLNKIKEEKESYERQVEEDSSHHNISSHVPENLGSPVVMFYLGSGGNRANEVDEILDEAQSSDEEKINNRQGSVEQRTHEECLNEELNSAQGRSNETQIDNKESLKENPNSNKKQKSYYYCDFFMVSSTIWTQIDEFIEIAHLENDEHSSRHTRRKTDERKSAPGTCKIGHETLGSLKMRTNVAQFPNRAHNLKDSTELIKQYLRESNDIDTESPNVSLVANALCVTENSGRPSNVIEASTSNQANLNQRPDHSLNEAQNEDVQDSVMYATRRAQNDPRAQNTSRNRNRRQNKDELTDTDEELTDTDKKLTDTDEELTDTDEENASRRANRRLNRSGRDDGMSGFIQRLHDNDEPGYLSWDNRLKNLAPQNYGNEYYFELFKTIPPTLLIAASDGAKNIPPIPKWRQGAKELLDKLSTLENYHRVDVEGSHDVHYTHPERVVPFINAFLKDNKVYSKL